MAPQLRDTLAAEGTGLDPEVANAFTTYPSRPPRTRRLSRCWEIPGTIYRLIIGAGKPRLLVEKPFSYNSQSASRVIDAADREFGEEPILPH